ncbi:undecaprenyl-phosphate glucose phosphotransferase [Alteromonas sediminis]|uniref:Undecaprenyl-phosphate glucose phosphotransferase n=1 Tax=Alteromonas sediminis TaxID=2259342 RepID=A0A3N5YF14_9ALTE|nr:undecaprenyl-phosphate glucose phosphotransferase [Alteromonas sediminis]RPJ68505.1 undecaprenyl-phosphate glucose phosphotransferase [Alteromonas sediminis]
MTNHTGFVKNNVNTFAAAYRFVDLLVIHLSLMLALVIYGLEFSNDYLLLSLTANITFAIAAESNALYRSWRSGFFKQLIFYTFVSWGVAVTAMLLLMFFSKTSETYSRVAIALWIGMGGLALISWRTLFGIFLTHMRKKGHNTRSVAIIGMSEAGIRLAHEINYRKETGYRVEAFYDDRGQDRLDNTFADKLVGDVESGVRAARANQYDTIFIAMPMKAEARIRDILFRLGDTTADVQLIPNFFMFSMMQTTMSHVGNIQTLSVYNNPMSGGAAALKRFEDIVLSSIILSLIALPMLAIAIGIKLTSKGPVIFKQDRYGLNGKRIKMWKFRSMTVTENSDVVTQATKGDARITRFGAFLRRTSLDELPQFINVLKGDMSVIGPRPHAVAHNEEYRKMVDFYMLRHKVKPGITGWAQVNGWRGETETLDKMKKRIEYDLDYIRHWSLWMDFKILILTLFKGFVNKNAY